MHAQDLSIVLVGMGFGFLSLTYFLSIAISRTVKSKRASTRRKIWPLQRAKS